MAEKFGDYFTKEDIKEAFAPSDEKSIVRFFIGVVAAFILFIFTAIMFTLYLAPIIGTVLCICKAAGTLETMTWVQACSPFMAYTVASILTIGVFKLGGRILNVDTDEEEEEVEVAEEVEIVEEE